ncbi:3,4-dihydroxy-2-butanone-4-phosphate synthase [Amycolatopsis mongoliensis]|uniref:3,4-dihydroxy-2-butanone-4-phosphate synthase n=1 Tax=Amycolatopsis mongoliensis TaxID=715475 RepID=A0A9Y2JPP4_9PSEU|nr:3,4-dihydroxy-2-butanone-4-phosphate synthase [Amycolatopsis sp. 4-36]WIY01122.1 3,4-dihydroxy-2-butanone-4-phosphate synthase [Amycolatopsis sp. 4-36]
MAAATEPGPDDTVRAAFATGRPAVLPDEHGALLALPAQSATPALLHFAIRHSSGLVHAAAPSAWLDRLRIPDQPVLAADHSGLSFTVAVDAAAGVGTGISARDRASTMRVIADPRAVPADLIRPGHVLPIRCADEGFLARPRVWERAVDLVASAGHSPVAMVCRLVDDEGQPLVGVPATRFAVEHGLPMLRRPSIRRPARS